MHRCMPSKTNCCMPHIKFMNDYFCFISVSCWLKVVHNISDADLLNQCLHFQFVIKQSI